jgi:protein-disulfide isomerase
MNYNNFFKYLSIFLVGLILGYLVRDINFSPATVSTITEAGSIKIIGRENAPITITEYSDFQCPLCKKYYDETYPTIIKNYVETGKAKYVFKHFPLNIHPQAPSAALASECAVEQNNFWEMHNLLFETQSTWSGKSDYLDTFKKLAAQLQLNTEQFNQCLDSKKHEGNVNKDYQEGLTKGVRGTPTVYINDEVIIGAQDISAFTTVLDRLAGVKTPAATPTVTE